MLVLTDKKPKLVTVGNYSFVSIKNEVWKLVYTLKIFKYFSKYDKIYNIYLVVLIQFNNHKTMNAWGHVFYLKTENRHKNV